MITVKSLQSSSIKADHVDPVFWSLNDIVHSCHTHSLVGGSVGIKEIREFSIHFAEFSGKRFGASFKKMFSCTVTPFSCD